MHDRSFIEILDFRDVPYSDPGRREKIEKIQLFTEEHEDDRDKYVYIMVDPCEETGEHAVRQPDWMSESV